MDILKVEGLTKKFNSRNVMENISFTIKKGTITSIIGPSGSGKSTILRCLNLLDKPDSGRVIYQDKPVFENKILIDENTYRQKIGLVFQNLNLWPRYTVLKNLILAPVLTKRLNQKKAVEKARKVLNIVNMEGYEKRLAETLSGGESQRVAIARALMMDYEVLLLDEITSALDPESISGLLDVLYKLAHSGVTLIIVSHHLDFANRISDDIIMLDQGKIIEQGSETISNPKKDRTKIFIKHLLKAR